LIGIYYENGCEFTDSALITHHAPEKEIISYDRIAQAQLDKTIQRWYHVDVVSGVRSWETSAKILSKFTSAQNPDRLSIQRWKGTMCYHKT